ncbi:hypothetical protein [Paenibacillus sp. sgz302251]|uniref:hypothetical protein n=1 Tax=Paenibacillus sp. sgz302251 TaxID=3414493 RepID=UPI003C7C726B
MANMSEGEIDQKYNEFMLTSAIVERNQKADQKYYEAIGFQIIAFIIAFFVCGFTNEFIIPKESEVGRLVYFGVTMIALNIIYFSLNKGKMFYPQIDELIKDAIRK